MRGRVPEGGVGLGGDFFSFPSFSPGVTYRAGSRGSQRAGPSSSASCALGLPDLGWGGYGVGWGERHPSSNFASMRADDGQG